MAGEPAEAQRIGGIALAGHDKAFGLAHSWTRDAAHVTADALDALGRGDEAEALRTRYGVGYKAIPPPAEQG
jgi:hypothetical protein